MTRCDWESFASEGPSGKATLENVAEKQRLWQCARVYRAGQPVSQPERMRRKRRRKGGGGGGRRAVANQPDLHDQRALQFIQTFQTKS